MEKKSHEALESAFRCLKICKETEQISGTIAAQLKVNTDRLARLEPKINKIDNRVNKARHDLKKYKMLCCCTPFYNIKNQKYQETTSLTSENEMQNTPKATTDSYMTEMKINKASGDSTSTLTKLKSFFVFTDRFSLSKKASGIKLENCKILKEHLAKAGVSVNNMLSDANYMTEQIVEHETLINNLLRQSCAIDEKINRALMKNQLTVEKYEKKKFYGVFKRLIF